MSIDAIYNSKILDYAGNIGGIGRLGSPDGSAKAHSKLCGSTVIVDVVMNGDKVEDFAQDVKACALGQASASILAANVVGADVEELRTARQQLRSMLKDNGPAPTGRFEELKFLEPVRDYRPRHASTMLAFDAVVEAAEQALATSRPSVA
ncbi:MAG: iron-sulfur cluster assembly scaffold protein [Ahrensia sp.]|nr:iron-sulfur cluster assembly scaffold protein [Ahrensia sp.]